jgi:hypothetical protein
MKMETKMMIEHNVNSQNKLSPEFATRLIHLEPQQKIHIIVLLQIVEPLNLGGKRQSPADRQSVIQTVKNSAAQAFANITEIIQHFEGHSLAEHPDAIGSIPIEITVAGINPLLQSPSVKAIIENQAILPCETPQKRDFLQDKSLR